MRGVSDPYSRAEDAGAYEKNAFNIIIISITLICMVVFSLFAVKFSTIFYIMISGACGVVVYLLGKIRKEEKQ